jgi:ectoine hydroxylase-related dioxygenase (phytanoyl-CoA dioxygenase family)
MTAATSLPTITGRHRETFQRDGAVCLRGLFSAGEIEQLRSAVDEIMAHPSPLARDYAEPGAGSFFTDVFNWRNNRQIRDVLFASRIGEAAAAILGSQHIRLYNDHLLVKEPGTDIPTRWHQDLPYFRINGSQACSVWIGLDPVTKASGAMSFVTGSHTWGKMFRPVGLGNGTPTTEDPFDGPIPDIDAAPETYPTVCYEMEPGDCTVHHVLTVHGAQGNTNATVRRRGFSVRVTGDDITWLKRAFSPTGIDGGLADGEPLHGELFPELWPRAARVSA